MGNCAADSGVQELKVKQMDGFLTLFLYCIVLKGQTNQIRTLFFLSWVKYIG